MKRRKNEQTHPKLPCTLLKEARLHRGLSQAQLAEILHLTGQSISNVERNHTTPSLRWLWRACSVLNIDPSKMAQAFADIEYIRVRSAMNDQELEFYRSRR